MYRLFIDFQCYYKLKMQLNNVQNIVCTWFNLSHDIICAFVHNISSVFVSSFVQLLLKIWKFSPNCIQWEFKKICLFPVEVVKIFCSLFKCFCKQIHLDITIKKIFNMDFWISVDGFLDLCRWSSWSLSVEFLISVNSVLDLTMEFLIFCWISCSVDH